VPAWFVLFFCPTGEHYSDPRKKKQQQMIATSSRVFVPTRAEEATTHNEAS
jgi:hypothetical protein